MSIVLGLPSVPFQSLQDYLKTHRPSIDLHRFSNNDSSTNAIIDELVRNSEENKQLSLGLDTEAQSKSQKRQILSLDRFQLNENQANFSQISAGLMEIMYEMITILPDYNLNEILNLLKYESFIMFAMVNHIF